MSDDDLDDNDQRIAATAQFLATELNTDYVVILAIVDNVIKCGSVVPKQSHGLVVALLDKAAKLATEALEKETNG